MTQTLRIPAQRQAPTAPAVRPGAAQGPSPVVPGSASVERSWAEVLRVGAARAVLTTVVWSAVVAFVAYKIVDLVIGLRVSEEEEREGLDITSHGETAYNR